MCRRCSKSVSTMTIAPRKKAVTRASAGTSRRRSSSRIRCMSQSVALRASSASGGRPGHDEPGGTSMTLDLLVEGRIATLAGETGFGWVEAIGVAGGRVVAAGPQRDVERAGRRVDATSRPGAGRGRAARPTDAHIHLVEAARAVNQVDLSDGRDPRRRPRDRRSGPSPAEPEEPGSRARVGTSSRWGAWPTAADLDRVAPGPAGVPVVARAAPGLGQLGGDGGGR